MIPPTPPAPTGADSTCAAPRSRPAASPRSCSPSPRPPARAGSRPRPSWSAAPGSPGSSPSCSPSGTPPSRSCGSSAWPTAASAAASDDAGRGRRAVRHLPARLAAHAERARHRPAGDRARFLPLAIALAAGVHVGNRVLMHAGVRVPMAIGFAATAAGMLLLSSAGAGGSYLAGVLPGMLVAGLGLGVVLVCVSVSVMTGAKPRRDRDALRPEHHRPRDRRHDRHRRPRDDRRRLADRLGHGLLGSATPSSPSRAVRRGRTDRA